MAVDLNRLEFLLERYSNNTISEAEFDELCELAGVADGAPLLVGELKNAPIELVDQEKMDRVLARVLDRKGIGNKELGIGNSVLRQAQDDRPAHNGKVRRLWVRWVAAASIVLVIGIATFVVLRQAQNDKGQVAATKEQRFKNDIDPAKQGVYLTLANGKKILMDTVANGVSTRDVAQVLKQDSSLSYLQSNSSEVVYNTVSTEKGRTFHLKLNDGTEVWLDALSSIHFPTSFPGADRVVEVTGQAYFEVAHIESPALKGTPLKRGTASALPFIVKVGNTEVRVLGTHFNVNGYDNGNVQTTLLEGSVRVIGNWELGIRNSGVVIKPGEQAFGIGNRELGIRKGVDVDEVMAWKNGRFQFNGSSIEEIMSQLGRWYDMEVVYKDKIKETFVADIQRDMPVSKLLGLLEGTKQVKFLIEGDKITVMKP